jgi:hypothetical protein
MSSPDVPLIEAGDEGDELGETRVIKTTPLPELTPPKSTLSPLSTALPLNDPPPPPPAVYPPPPPPPVPLVPPGRPKGPPKGHWRHSTRQFQPARRPPVPKWHLRLHRLRPREEADQEQWLDTQRNHRPRRLRNSPAGLGHQPRYSASPQPSVATLRRPRRPCQGYFRYLRIPPGLLQQRCHRCQLSER